jgi:hypothetical protein
MPIQIEQTLPKCRRCGRMTHARDPQRIDEGELVFCTERCQREYHELAKAAACSEDSA